MSIASGQTRFTVTDSTQGKADILAVPTMFAATAKSMYDYMQDGGAFTSEHFQLFAVGNAVAFIVAIIAIRGFIGYLTKHGFKAFGWYRIAVGGALIALHLLGVPMQML